VIAPAVTAFLRIGSAFLLVIGDRSPSAVTSVPGGVRFDRRRQFTFREPFARWRRSYRPWRARTVLVVDDERTIRDVVARYLERDGYRAVVATTARRRRRSRARAAGHRGRSS
jgi:hypothetical protein